MNKHQGFQQQSGVQLGNALHLMRSVGDAPVVWRGVLHILIPDLLVQLTTMKATNTTGLFGALKVSIDDPNELTHSV